MIPDCPLDKVGSAGNAAGTGARIALLNRGARAEIERVVERIEKVETAIEPRFQEHFVAAMAIPHKTADYANLARAVQSPGAARAGRGRGGAAPTPARGRRDVGRAGAISGLTGESCRSTFAPRERRPDHRSATRSGWGR